VRGPITEQASNFDIRALWRLGLSVRVTHMATVGVRGLNSNVLVSAVDGEREVQRPSGQLAAAAVLPGSTLCGRSHTSHCCS